MNRVSKCRLRKDAINVLVALTVLGFGGCKTSGDLRSEKMNYDPAEIKTVAKAPPSSPAQFSAQDELVRELEVLKGQIQERDYLRQQERNQYEARIQTLEQEKARLMEEIQILKGATTAAAAQSSDLIWDRALRDLQEKNFVNAAVAFKDLLQNFPNDSRVERAMILRAQSEYAAEQFKESLVSFAKYLDRYPKGNDRAMAWLGQGAALIRLKQTKDAKLFLGQCVSLHAKSKEAKVARKLLKTPNAVPASLFL